MAVSVKSIGGGGVTSSDVTAAKAQVLTGYTTITTDSNDEVIQGTMPNNGAVSNTITSLGGTYIIPEGYHNGSGEVTALITAGLLGLITAIKGTVENNTISVTPLMTAGTAGYNEMTATTGTPITVTSSEFTSDATATANDILAGLTAYIADGSKATGTIPSKGAETITPTTSDQVITSGLYLSGNLTILGDTNLVAANIAKDVTIFGITGTHLGGVDTSDATAVASDILSGKTAYIADGTKASGTIAIYDYSYQRIIGDKPTTLNLSTYYTGNEITNGYTCPTGVTMTGNDRGTAANTYVAIYTPNSDYYWTDGTRDTITITLVIEDISWNTKSVTETEMNNLPLSWGYKE